MSYSHGNQLHTMVAAVLLLLLFVCGSDGSTIYVAAGQSIQNAINGLPKDNSLVTINIAATTFKEALVISRANIVFVSNSSSANVILESSTDPVILINKGADSVSFYHIEARQMQGEAAGNHNAIKTYSAKLGFYFCKFVGFGDTAWWDAGSAYVYSSTIEGTVDYNYGAADVYFYKSNIDSSGKGHCTAAAHAQTDANGGFVFNDVNFTPVISTIPSLRNANDHSYPSPLTANEYNSTVDLGRPWQNYPKVIILNSNLNSHVEPAGWTAWNVPAADVFYAEYNNNGPGAGTSKRVSWSKQLTAAQASKYQSTKSFFSGVGLDVNWIDSKYII